MEEVVPPQSVVGEESSQPSQVEVLLEEWLMLLQMLVHPRDLQRLVVEELILPVVG